MPNLLLNGDFEGGFRAWNGSAVTQVAASWLPFWVARRPGDEAWENMRPIYTPVERAAQPSRVRQGGRAQGYSTSGGTHFAGLMQSAVVEGGQRVKLRAFASAWSTDANDPVRSTNPAPIYVRIGIDPNGGLNPFAPSVVWSAEKAASDAFTALELEAQASGSKVTAFLGSRVDQRRSNQAVFWDDASLEYVGQPGQAQPLRLLVHSEIPVIGFPVHVYASGVAAGSRSMLEVKDSTNRTLEVQQWEPAAVSGYVTQRWSFFPQMAGPHRFRLFVDGVERASSNLEVGPARRPNGPARGVPRVQFQRVFVLLPPVSGPEWVAAVTQSQAWQRSRWTIGYSPDDAAIGDLEVRKIIAVNPSLWREPLKPWFEQWYPGVQFFAVEAAGPGQLSRALDQLRL